MRRHAHFHDDLNQLTDEDFDESTAWCSGRPDQPHAARDDIRRAWSWPTATAPEVVVQHTFLTPDPQRPLDLGADATVQLRHQVPGRAREPAGGVVSTNDDAWRAGAPGPDDLGGAPPTDLYRLIQLVKTLGSAWTASRRTPGGSWSSCGAPRAARVAPADDDAEARTPGGPGRRTRRPFSFQLVPGKDVRAFLGALRSSASP
ncbi:hypothetical protein QJS66_15365 [Kocuria rhizophila]|nr:hypothetical protein QJS66_15365 [Kocuria rhizophila]